LEQADPLDESAAYRVEKVAADFQNSFPWQANA
jgi:hypothetical protein